MATVEYDETYHGKMRQKDVAKILRRVKDGEGLER